MNGASNAWRQAARLAEQTPVSRNRTVDFLRAVSIIAVICGHWLVVAPYLAADGLQLDDIFSAAPWTQWLTWLLQVMPIFFIVGGYANGVSWQSAQRRSLGYNRWLAARLRRLIAPVLPVLIVWAVIGLIANAFHVERSLLQAASRFALLPAWFLVIYVIVVACVPLAWRAWQRYQFASFWALAACATLVDLVVFALGWKPVGWINYLFIWMAVHQLGFAWQDGRFDSISQSLPWALGGIIGLVALVAFGPYPISMVSVQGEEISNTLPPNLTMLALGIFQSGAALSLQTRLKKWLAKPKLWTAAILVNGMIMTLFLWHVTVLILTAGLALALGGIGLRFAPGTSVWWLTRPLWILALGAILLLVTPIFLRYERLPPRKNPPVIPAWRLLLGGSLFCIGLAILTLKGIPSDIWPGIRLLELTLPFIGGAIAGIIPLRHLFFDRPKMQP